MFTAYIDDAGSDPNQKVAVATALVIPVSRIINFESEWEAFNSKWQISNFHTSECAAANSKSEFAGWDQEKRNAIFRRVRQIIRRYGTRSFSFSVLKSDYDATVPDKYLDAFGRYHYTYAMHSLLSALDGWACRNGIEHPLEYVFDWIDKTHKEQKAEIEESLSRSEAARPGRFTNHYTFGKRQDFAGLQCVDLIGWTCYRFSQKAHAGTPLTSLQEECWEDFNGRNDGNWLTSVGQRQTQLLKAVASFRKIADKGPTPAVIPVFPVEWRCRYVVRDSRKGTSF